MNGQYVVENTVVHDHHKNGGETSFSSSAAAATTSLNVEPGSYASPMARLRHRFGSALGSLGSKVGRTAMARIAPVFGSTTMTTPEAARVRVTTLASSWSAIY